MSIQPSRVLARIIEQVRCAPGSIDVSLQLGPDAFTEPGEGERLELYRVGARNREAFATPVHLWACALRAFLDARGKRDEFVGVAGFAMCESIAGGELADCLGTRLAGLRRPLDLRLGSVVRAYRMIDSPCRMSILLELDHESVALFWEHGAGLLPVAPCWRAALALPCEPV